MATVYKAYQPSLARHVAIKVLPAFFAEEEGFRERFQQEAIAIAKLRHPNILQVFDYGEEGGVTYIVSEFVDGGTLAEQVGNPLPPARARLARCRGAPGGRARRHGVTGEHRERRGDRWAEAPAPLRGEARRRRKRDLAAGRLPGQIGRRGAPPGGRHGARDPQAQWERRDPAAPEHPGGARTSARSPSKCARMRPHS